MCPRGSPEDDRRSTPSAKSSIASFISCGVGVRGACCLMTSLLRRSCLTTFGCGGRMALANSCMTGGAAMSGWQLASDASPVPASSIANPSKRPKKGAPRVRGAQAGQRPQAASPRRYVRPPPGCRRHSCQCARPGRGHATPRRPPEQVCPAPIDLGGSSLCRDLLA
jgi:hypothetical protein